MRASLCPQTLAAYSVTRTARAPGVGIITRSRAQILPGRGGRWSPWRHLPLLIPLSIVSGTSPKAGSTVRPRASTWPFGTARTAKMSTMKREAAQILKDALALPTEARAALAGSLLESLDTEVDEDAEA